MIVKIALKTYIATGIMLNKWKNAKAVAKHNIQHGKDVLAAAMQPAPYVKAKKSVLG